MHRTRTALAVATLGGALTLTTAGHASALPNCGGNNHQWQAPVVCTNSRLIDGTTFTVVVNERANGFLTVDYTLSAPRTAPTLINVRSSQGKSSSPISTDPSAVIPVGATSGHLELAQALCGQLDVKAVFVGGGQATGRVAGPWINNDICLDIGSTVPPGITAPPPPSVPQSPPTTVQAPGTPTPPGSLVPPTSTLERGSLPSTGRNVVVIGFVGVCALLLGATALILRRPVR